MRKDCFMKKNYPLIFVSLILMLILSVFLFNRFQVFLVRMMRSEDPSSLSSSDFFTDPDAVFLTSTEFDGQTVEFYYDESLLHNDGVYYTLSGKNQQIYYEQFSINSQDQKLRFYADFGSKYIICADGQELIPNEILEIQTNQVSMTIPIYYLDKSKEIRMKEKEKEDIQFSCSATQYCAKTDSIDSTQFFSLTKSWKEVSYSEINANYTDFSSLFSLQNNWTTYDFYSGKNTLEVTSVKEFQNQSGQHFILIDTNTSTLYQLTQSQYDEIIELISQ